ncbi:hypothetical protein JTB14_032625 [Gonioctena quinquepunctata]|nr:hypothetical protein JTB14_032625 [Gonioctena quinquepunctata]
MHQRDLQSFSEGLHAITKMYSRSIYFLALAALSLAIEYKKPSRPIENHLRIINPDPNDAEQMRFEASGNAKQNKKSNKPDNGEKPKTLSQQIADGKYGLIQKELFDKPHKRPGILSYENNPEVPNDSFENLGGLNKEEIWLAENHLLVLRGGKYPAHDDKRDNFESPWPPLDNYKAPLHQVKIPKHPKVPPPFPVQLTEGGPFQILGTNSSRTLNESDQSSWYPVPPPEGYDPSAFYPYDTNSSDPTPGPLRASTCQAFGGILAGGAVPPTSLERDLSAFFGLFAPRRVHSATPGNQTDDLYDYDDPSIYYPPPYSFFYPKSNTSAVPAGPLVPGIVLPPPPNFFAALEETTLLGLQRKTSLTAYKQKTEVTKLRPVSPPKVYSNEISNKPFRIYGPPAPNRSPIVSTTQVPLKYHTTSNDIETNSVTQESDVRYAGTRKGKSVNLDRRQASTTTTRRASDYESSGKTDILRRQYRAVLPEAEAGTDCEAETTAVHIRNCEAVQHAETAVPVHPATGEERYVQHPHRPAPESNTAAAAVLYHAQDHLQARTEAPLATELSHQDQFRPGPPKYSVEIQKAIEITSTPAPIYRPHYNNQRPIFYEQQYRPTAEPQPQNYYSTPKPEYDYETVTQKAKYVVTPRPVSQYSFEATQNPIFRGFYTKPDEGYFDDRTKKYFTMFGRKLTATTPLPSVEQTTTDGDYRNYRQRPISLEGDTLVNYLNPRPTINPDAEIIDVGNPPRYPNVVRYPARPEQPKEQNPEIIKAIPIEVESSKSQDGSFISYELPGDDGAHFYFLTPQLTHSRDQGAGFYYSRPQRSRIRRNEKTIDKER